MNINGIRDSGKMINMSFPSSFIGNPLLYILRGNEQ